MSHDLLKFNSSHWLKLQHSDWGANLVKDFLLQKKKMKAFEFITGHVIFKLHYYQIYQMKTTQPCWRQDHMHPANSSSS